MDIKRLISSCRKPLPLIVELFHVEHWKTPFAANSAMSIRRAGGVVLMPRVHTCASKLQSLPCQCLPRGLASKKWKHFGKRTASLPAFWFAQTASLQVSVYMVRVARRSQRRHCVSRSVCYMPIFEPPLFVPTSRYIPNVVLKPAHETTTVYKDAKT